MGPEAELRTQPGHLENFENLTTKIIFMLTIMMLMMAMTVASQLAMSSARQLQQWRGKEPPKFPDGDRHSNEEKCECEDEEDGDDGDDSDDSDESLMTVMTDEDEG